MPRNGSGTSTVLNSFSAGATISSSDVNANFSDVATQLTNSLPRDGQAAMTAPLKVSAGTVAAPSLSFSTDTDTGLYRVGGDNLGVSIGGTKVVDISSSGLDVSSGTVQQGGADLIPAGTIMEYGGDSAPTGWRECDGSEVSRTGEAALFAAIGTLWGSGDGSTTFNLPDLGGRASIGREATATRVTTAGAGFDADTVGNTGGSQTHTLTSDELASHTHDFSGTTASNGAHTHTGAFGGAALEGGGGANASGINSASTSSSGAHTHTFSGTSDAAGSGDAHNNVQPSAVVMKIIKT